MHFDLTQSRSLDGQTELAEAFGSIDQTVLGWDRELVPSLAAITHHIDDVLSESSFARMPRERPDGFSGALARISTGP
jgi:hypothetical protein